MDNLPERERYLMEAERTLIEWRDLLDTAKARIKELEGLHDAARTLARATAEADESIQAHALLVPIPEYDAFLAALAALAGKGAHPSSLMGAVERKGVKGG